LRNISAKRVQVDEIWSFVGGKAKNVKAFHFENGGLAGEVWTFTAIDADTKLVIAGLWAGESLLANSFRRLQAGCRIEIQLATDGHKMYLTAVPDAFGESVDYAMLGQGVR
jgi:hypothetical protein